MGGSLFEKGVQDGFVNARFSAEILFGAAAGDDVFDAAGDGGVLGIGRCDDSVAVVVARGDDAFFIADLGQRNLRAVFRSEISQNEKSGGAQNLGIGMVRIQRGESERVGSAVDSGIIAQDADEPADCIFQLFRPDSSVSVGIQKREELPVQDDRVGRNAVTAQRASSRSGICSRSSARSRTS